MKDQDLTVAAYVDGELDTGARARFEADMSRDPALAARVTAQRRLRERLAAAYDPILSEATPMRLKLTAEAANDHTPRRFGALQWGAVAASLIVGVLAGRIGEPEHQPLTVRGDLAHALDKQLVSDAGPIQVRLSFRTADGSYCRTFQSAPDQMAGVACRENGGWRARTVTAWRPTPTADYRTASADSPPEVLAAVDALIAGQALDAAAERNARDRGWRP